MVEYQDLEDYVELEPPEPHSFVHFLGGREQLVTTLHIITFSPNPLSDNVPKPSVAKACQSFTMNWDYVLLQLRESKSSGLQILLIKLTNIF